MVLGEKKGISNILLIMGDFLRIKQRIVENCAKMGVQGWKNCPYTKKKLQITLNTTHSTKISKEKKKRQ